ncbi:peritrophin-1-like, partial [Anopheles cruzii]|uniref:peritrophin-1-like n=1 Tax=Anopheles cruzii TaxID=68878 RepID=UPI0022EC68A4
MEESYLHRTICVLAVIVSFGRAVASFDCQGAAGASTVPAIHALPNSCTGYVTCIGWIQVVAHCPEGSVWSDPVKSCVKMASAEVQCAGNKVDRVRRDIDIETMTTCAETCPQFFDPRNLVLMPHTICTKYNLCVLGLKLSVSCPNDLRFNVDK